ncbi:MAG: TetR/AcrR family transcriptional regulator, partial [Actinomycetes bacterium]
MSSPEQTMTIDHDHDSDDSAGSERRSLRDRVLRTAVDLVHERGEAGLKISDVVALSGASVGTIYAEFGDREGLVQAVQVELFRGQAAIDAAALSALVEHARSREDMVEGLCAIARMSIDAS